MGGSVGSSDPTDWSIIFDLIASEYSYNWDQFTGMTYRLLDASLEAIQRRSHNNVVIQAALRGIKVDLYKKQTPVNKETLEASRTEMEKILREKQNAAHPGNR